VVQGGGEQGLLGLAFHPQYQMNGRFFVFFTAKPPPGAGNNTVAEFRVSPGDPNVAVPTPVRTLFSLEDEFTNHNGGMIAFGPDGYLYVGMGDEGGGGDPKENAQNLGVLYGKLLRLDVDNGGNPFPPDFTYAIPPGNPFIGQPGARPEIWAYGFRNPWRWSFDRVTGDLLIGDVGQGAWEEVNFIPAGQKGGNYGWDDREGAHCYEPPSGCVTAGRIDPILEYGHNSSDGGCSITGGYRYRGTASPALVGVYLYADFCTGRVWKGIQNGNSWNAVEALDTSHNVTSFGEDPVGEVYVLTNGGSIFRVAQASLSMCIERPRVTLQSTQTGPGLLSVTLRANDSPSITNNGIVSVAVTQIVNAFVTVEGQSNQQSPFTVTIPGSPSSTQMTIRRQQTGQAFRADLAVTDKCGVWKTFVGGGTGLP
jgi:glucose/arabinose dehydrogenase